MSPKLRPQHIIEASWAREDSDAVTAQSNTFFPQRYSVSTGVMFRQ